MQSYKMHSYKINVCLSMHLCVCQCTAIAAVVVVVAVLFEIMWQAFFLTPHAHEICT